MDDNQFQSWVSGVKGFRPAQRLQRLQTQGLLSGVTGKNASLMAIDARLAETRQCPHCNTAEAASRGMARGLRRYQCKACKKTFNAATGTALQGLHKKGRWLTFGDRLTDGATARESAERCNFAVSTSFRWRLRFLGTQGQNPPKLRSIILDSAVGRP